MGSRNYIINVNDLSVTDRGKYKLRALAAGLERCAIRKIGDVNADIPGLQAISESDKEARVTHIEKYIATGNWPQSITQRELWPQGGDLVVATAIDSWLTAALAAVGTFYTCFQAVVSPQLVNDRLMVCYGVSIDSAAVPLPVDRIRFRIGGAAGNIKAEFNLAQLSIRQEVDGLFSEVVVIDPQQIFAIQARCRNATGVAEIVNIHNFLFEPVGNIS